MTKDKFKTNIWIVIIWDELGAESYSWKKYDKKELYCKLFEVLDDWFQVIVFSGGTTRSRTGLQSFAGFCITDLP